MKTSRNSSDDKRIQPSLMGWLLVLSLFAVGTQGWAAAQAPTSPFGGNPAPTGSLAPQVGLPQPLDGDPFGNGAESGLPQILPLPPRSVTPYIDGLRANDAAFEVLLGHGRILTLKEDITVGQVQSLVAVGDPSVIEFTVLTARQIRITGMRIGVTDLSITNAAGKTMGFEVRVVCDLEPLAAKLKAVFPDANLRLAQLRENVIVEGQARDSGQVARILQMINGYLRSVQAAHGQTDSSQTGQSSQSPLSGLRLPDTNVAPPLPTDPKTPATNPLNSLQPAGLVSPESNPGSVSGPSGIVPEVINMIRLPGSQQVLLKVRVAELNRSALRRIGANFLGVDPSTGAIVGTQIAGPVSASATAARNLVGSATSSTTVNSTVFGIFQDSQFEFTLNALRRNSMLKILAEPNLVALHGHTASFLAGGEFPVPVASAGAGGTVPTVNVTFKKFGVQLNFLPFIIDGDVIRLAVAPVVSQIDNSISVTLVQGGSPVPGLSTRQAQTTVEMREGQTLAIAGLLQLELNGTTDRIPGLGDLPVIGPFFSNTTSQRIEKELVVLVTPYLVEAMNKDQVPPTPGDEVNGPNDLEFFLLNRIEGRTGNDFRATTAWDDPMHLTRILKLVPKYVNGPSGFSD